MKLTTIIVALAVFSGFVNVVNWHPTKTITVYLPDAGQGSGPLCISNRTQSDLQVPRGPTLKPGESVTASVVRDFQWGFAVPQKSSDRADVDCFVIQ